MATISISLLVQLPHCQQCGNSHCPFASAIMPFRFPLSDIAILPQTCIAMLLECRTARLPAMRQTGSATKAHVRALKAGGNPLEGIAVLLAIRQYGKQKTGF